MSKLESPRSPNRLKRLSEERDKLQTESVQIHSMLLSIEELIVEEILSQVSDSALGKAPKKEGTAGEDIDNVE